MFTRLSLALDSYSLYITALVTCHSIGITKMINYLRTFWKVKRDNYTTNSLEEWRSGKACFTRVAKIPGIGLAVTY